MKDQNGTDVKKNKEKSPEGKDSIINEASEESFPASDAPNWSGHHYGTVVDHSHCQHNVPIKEFAI